MYKLIITEKPSVARDFARILNVTNNKEGYIEGIGYIITWCVGHLITMSYPYKYGMEYKKWDLNTLPFLPTEYKYEVIENVTKQFEIVKKLLNHPNIDTIYYAGDSGREGQAIAELVRRYSGVNKNAKELRVWIDSYTENEILNGIKNALPMSNYDPLGNAGVMRGIEDYAMGINFTRALTLKYGYMLSELKENPTISIGRVMTCVLGMVVNKEWEIRNFKETNYFITTIICKGQNNPFEAEWKVTEKSKYFNHPALYNNSGFLTENDAKNVIKGNTGIVTKKENKQETKKAPLLFNLAELQSKCASLFHITPSDTLNIAQSLYEKGLTTYPRTDARVLSTAILCENESKLRKLSAIYPAVNSIPDLSSISINISKPYVDDSKITDHYAIIPTGNTNISSLNALEQKVFDLICRRYISIFFPSAQFERVSVEISSMDGTETFFATARRMLSAGYLEIANESVSVSDDIFYELNSLNKGDNIFIEDIDVRAHKTSPPKRYTSGSIILAMENAGNLIENEELRQQIKTCGIGTSATRADILEKLIKIDYLTLNKSKQILTPTEFGEAVFEIVRVTIPSFLSPEMTASWEKGLANIENQTVTVEYYKQVLDEYVRKHIDFIKNNDVSSLIKQNIVSNPYISVNNIPDGYEKRESIDTGLKCPICGQAVLYNKHMGKEWYVCKMYKKNCGFSIGKICGILIDRVQLEKIITTQKTDVIKNFYSANKNFYFDSILKMDIDFTQKTASLSFHREGTTSDLQCPKCGMYLKENDSCFFCDCGCYYKKIFCKRVITKDEIKKLITEKTTGVLYGFYSDKKHKQFKAELILDNDFKMSFAKKKKN